MVKEGKRHVFLLREKKVICPKVGLVISERERGKTKNKIWRDIKKVVAALWKGDLGKGIFVWSGSVRLNEFVISVSKNKLSYQ